MYRSMVCIASIDFHWVWETNDAHAAPAYVIIRSTYMQRIWIFMITGMGLDLYRRGIKFLVLLWYFFRIFLTWALVLSFRLIVTPRYFALFAQEIVWPLIMIGRIFLWFIWLKIIANVLLSFIWNHSIKFCWFVFVVGRMHNWDICFWIRT